MNGRHEEVQRAVGAVRTGAFTGAKKPRKIPDRRRITPRRFRQKLQAAAIAAAVGFAAACTNPEVQTAFARALTRALNKVAP